MPFQAPSPVIHSVEITEDNHLYSPTLRAAQEAKELEERNRQEEKARQEELEREEKERLEREMEANASAENALQSSAAVAQPGVVATETETGAAKTSAEPAHVNPESSQQAQSAPAVEDTEKSAPVAGFTVGDPVQIPGFSHEVHSDRISYTNEETGQLAFHDEGKRVSLELDACESLKTRCAAIELFDKKHPDRYMHFNGDENFQRGMVEAAVEMGLSDRVQPELHEMVSAAQRAREDRLEQEQLQAQAAAGGVTAAQEQVVEQEAPAAVTATEEPRQEATQSATAEEVEELEQVEEQAQAAPARASSAPPKPRPSQHQVVHAQSQAYRASAAVYEARDNQPPVNVYDEAFSISR